MKLLIILGALMILCVILIIIAIIGDFHMLGQCAFIGLLISYVVFVAIAVTMAIHMIDYEPTALDVYRGKTALEITYRDSVAIDSTVVYEVR